MPPGKLAHAVRELRELGPAGLLFRLGWELRTRSGFEATADRIRALADHARNMHAPEAASGPFADPGRVADRIRPLLRPADLERLSRDARDASRGRIRCFGRWQTDFGDPIDWHRDPASGRRWDASAHWTRALRGNGRVGDIKLSWEPARFPHAFLIARATAFGGVEREPLASALESQIDSFESANLPGRGIHWASSQEIVIRLLAWTFACGVFGQAPTPQPSSLPRLLGRAIAVAAPHIERHIGYARHAVYNNHLLSEALGLLLAGSLLPDHPRAGGWIRLGHAILGQQADRQFYPDGGYIQQSHTYHRLAMQNLLAACAIARIRGEPPDPRMLTALIRSVDFLAAQQNPSDGRLPNYGANDGGLPLILSVCDYSDFRPTMQAASIAARGERLYEPGPWDEESAWLLGPDALDAPLRPPTHRSVSFLPTGFHLLRGRDPGSFCAFRCGSLRDRFSQIDMLHLDLWWRGQNVLADGGSYLYNGPPEWHDHFMRTGSHNTLTVDGRDQMVHWRKFKTLYPTNARLLHFDDCPAHTLCAGEHYGFRRHPGSCVHRRSVLFVKDDLWVVVDTISGAGRHRVRLHWLAGEFPHRADPGGTAGLTLETPAGPFAVRVYDKLGKQLPGDVIHGRDDPPRGWVSRYYGEKAPAASLAVECEAEMPLTLISLLAGGGRPELSVSDGRFRTVLGPTAISFTCPDGIIVDPVIGRDT